MTNQNPQEKLERGASRKIPMEPIFNQNPSPAEIKREARFNKMFKDLYALGQNSSQLEKALKFGEIIETFLVNSDLDINITNRQLKYLKLYQETNFPDAFFKLENFEEFIQQRDSSYMKSISRISGDKTCWCWDKKQLLDFFETYKQKNEFYEYQSNLEVSYPFIIGKRYLDLPEINPKAVEIINYYREHIIGSNFKTRYDNSAVLQSCLGIIGNKPTIESVNLLKTLINEMISGKYARNGNEEIFNTFEYEIFDAYWSAVFKCLDKTESFVVPEMKDVFDSLNDQQLLNSAKDVLSSPNAEKFGSSRCGNEDKPKKLIELLKWFEKKPKIFDTN